MDSLASLRSRWVDEQERFAADAAWVEGARLVQRFVADLDSLAAGTDAFQTGFLTSTVVAKILHIHPKTAARWCKQGRFRGAIQLGRTWRIPAAELEGFDPSPPRSTARLKPMARLPVAQDTEELLNAWKELP